MKLLFVALWAPVVALLLSCSSTRLLGGLPVGAAAASDAFPSPIDVMYDEHAELRQLTGGWEGRGHGVHGDVTLSYRHAEESGNKKDQPLHLVGDLPLRGANRKIEPLRDSR